MAKEVMLMADVAGLGAEGDVVRVADGYARNYLLPHKLAAPVTEAARRQLAKKRREREAQQAREREQAQALAQAVAQASCTIPVKAGAEGKLFGSVTTADIAAALQKQNLAIDKHQIGLAEPIRELGVYNVPIKLQPGLEAVLKLWVVEE